MKPVVEFLLEKGISVGDVKKCISAHPPILCYSVEERLKPLIEYLEGNGVKNVAQVLVNRPSLFGLDVDNNLRKMVDYLKYVETPTETILKYIEETL